MAEVSLQIIPGVSIGFGGGSDSPRLGEVVAAVNQSLETITNSIVGHVYRSNDYIDEILDDDFQRVISQILLSELGVKGSVERSESDLKEFIEYAARAVDRSGYNRDQDILTTINNGNASVNSSLSKAVRDIVGPMAAANDSLGNLLSGIDLKVSNNFSRVDQVMRDVLDYIQRKVEYVIENTVILDDGIFDTILTRVRDLLGQQSDNHAKVLDTYDKLINGTFAEAQAKLLVPEEEQASQTKRIADTLDKIEKKQPKKTIYDIMGPDGDQLLDDIFRNAENLFRDGEVNVKAVWDELLVTVAGTDFAGRLDDDCLLPFLRRGHATGFLGLLATALTTVMSWGILPFQMATVQANRQLQGFRTCYPDQILSPPQLREMYHILGYSRGELVQLFQRQGYSKDDANIIMQTWQTPADLTLLSNMLFRGVINKKEWASELGKHGYTKDTVDNIEKIITYIPPVQDLITMSVRDVFDTATVQQNRQSEDYPREFTEWMKKQGVSEDWALKYWQAHWRLPSETMGFEMFHRDIIDEARLKSLMKSLDIMPGWRDQLVKLSYNPLTRVDVRRMHSVGVLSEKEVDRAYRDIGYSPENAKRLTEFTVRLNDGEGAANLNVTDDLTRANILAFYKEGIINRTVAHGLLLAEGLGAAAAELLLQSADFDIERAERKQLRELVIARFKTGLWSYDQAVREAQRLDFSDRETEQIILDLELIQAKAHKLPSRADLDKMLKAGVVDAATYKATLIADGYSDYWAERYLELLRINDEEV